VTGPISAPRITCQWSPGFGARSIRRHQRARRRKLVVPATGRGAKREMPSTLALPDKQPAESPKEQTPTSAELEMVDAGHSLEARNPTRNLDEGSSILDSPHPGRSKAPPGCHLGGRCAHREGGQKAGDGDVDVLGLGMGTRTARCADGRTAGFKAIRRTRCRHCDRRERRRPFRAGARTTAPASA
jgi:hypothetical protein